MRTSSVLIAAFAAFLMSVSAASSEEKVEKKFFCKYDNNSYSLGSVVIMPFEISKSTQLKICEIVSFEKKLIAVWVSCGETGGGLPCSKLHF